MKNDRAFTLLFVSRFLDYPEQDFYEECVKVDNYVNQNISSEKLQKEFSSRLKILLDRTLIELQELYVETFDYKEKTGLYLTSQELGDSRRRGSALIQLQKLIEETGYEPAGKELADYIPMLLELIAVAPETEEIKQLERRLAYAIHRIFTHLPNSNPYYLVFDMLMTYIFKAPNQEEIARLENEREDADLDELPYPMLYG
ncbi:nitrate reductase molybdenum cofactor assembly chaperone [Bacillus sp. DTU_2020_1000418_1_SI_GHA_SEK_038]|uniref:nitrate reductase molybdenum cofactor assembly chaperone n=1 Tax=Bacillus sp. DTU_2020_1000418_1_SI_GHA_SEK_038 TaxID=3077585 RepID=UPI0028EDE84E|nr:nitrate reductase molybdenum cofactor assembly chaperone [Bacillus sp. DTU_2020_1000418_1_SI_GHA_SEK_038]WNS73566.1 nitrate reductase molybdenum cofactor assembly chaperone [Bacillus sp. DTU_2020_1000418_1_SI_GHA_SEK_038]